MAPRRSTPGLAIVAALAVFPLGCRAGFDADEKADASAEGIDASADAPTLVIELDQAAAEWVLTVPGRFSLQFLEAANWQPQRWTDAGRGTIDLTGSGSSIEAGSLVTPLILCVTGSCIGANDMEAARISLVAQDDRSVTFKIAWDWTLEGLPLGGQVIYTIDVEGFWLAEAQLINQGATELDAAMEIADTHVSELLPWRISQTVEPEYFGFDLPAEGEVGAVRFEVLLEAPAAEFIAADEVYNRYFSRPISLAPAATETVSWTSRIWRAP